MKYNTKFESKSKTVCNVIANNIRKYCKMSSSKIVRNKQSKIL